MAGRNNTLCQCRLQPGSPGYRAALTLPLGSAPPPPILYRTQQVGWHVWGARAYHVSGCDSVSRHSHEPFIRYTLATLSRLQALS